MNSTLLTIVILFIVGYILWRVIYEEWPQVDERGILLLFWLGIVGGGLHYVIK